MATRDNRSNFEPKLIQTDVISTNTTVDGASLDTSDFDGGITFVYLTTAYTDGTYTPIIEESATGSFSGEETAVADANLVGTEAGAVISADNSELDVLFSIGLVGTLKFVRSTIVSSGTSTGATISTIVVAVPEIMPSANLSA